jgi:hypothetical protein
MMRALCLEMCESQMELAECVCVCVSVCVSVCVKENLLNVSSCVSNLNFVFANMSSCRTLPWDRKYGAAAHTSTHTHELTRDHLEMWSMAQLLTHQLTHKLANYHDVPRTHELAEITEYTQLGSTAASTAGMRCTDSTNACVWARFLPPSAEITDCSPRHAPHQCVSALTHELTFENVCRASTPWCRSWQSACTKSQKSLMRCSRWKKQDNLNKCNDVVNKICY